MKKICRILENVDFFPVKKSFSKIFQNTAHFFYLNFISKKKNQKIRETFWRGQEGGRELITTASRRVSGEGRRS